MASEPNGGTPVRLATSRRARPKILEHLSVGRSNPEIARTLQISVETVHTHVAHPAEAEVKSKRDLIGVPVLGSSRVQVSQSIDLIVRNRRLILNPLCHPKDPLF